MRVGLVFGGRSVEHRVSVVSARTVAAGLRSAGHEVVALGIAQDGCWTDRASSEAALGGRLEALRPAGGGVAASLCALLEAGVEVLFPLVHGTWGEDGTLQGLCEMLRLPYVGADVTASALAMDKLQTKRLLRSCGVPVVDFEAITMTDFRHSATACLERLERLSQPVFVKPSCGGSSVGVCRVERPGELEDAVRFALRFDDAVVVERAVVGRELECSVLGDERLEASSVGEVVPGNVFYDYQDKYLQDRAQLRIPAPVPAPVGERVRSLAVEAFGVIGGSGMARVDFLLEGEETIFVNEINTLPGFTEISMYPKLWEHSGLPLPELVERLLDIALARDQRRSRLDRSIKEWLLQVGSAQS